MIIMRLMGGLGNQMFQYACGRILSLRTNHELVLETGLLASCNPITPRHYDLGVFNIAARLDTAVDLDERLSLFNYVRQLFGRHIPPPLLTIREQGLHYQPKIFPVQFDCLCLQGYWQSEKYFNDYSDVIRRDFTLRSTTTLVSHVQINAMNSVSLHIRRGDYVSDAKTNSIHGTCPLEYYHHAAAYIAERVSKPIFYIFSDDSAWVSANLKLDYPFHMVSDGHRPNTEELILMSCCHHHIIANSSFSWWGAWLNPRPDKIVCAPRIWFQDPSLDATDLVPATWVRL